MKKKNCLPLPLRAISAILAVAQGSIATPVQVHAEILAAASAVPVTQHNSSMRIAAKSTPVNRTIPKTTAPSKFPQFSSEPSDAEISRARVFEEPLIPTVQEQDKAENLALSNAISAYLHRESNDNVSAISQFLSAYPTSRWRA